MIYSLHKGIHPSYPTLFLSLLGGGGNFSYFLPAWQSVKCAGACRGKLLFWFSLSISLSCYVWQRMFPFFLRNLIAKLPFLSSFPCTFPLVKTKNIWQLCGLQLVSGVSTKRPGSTFQSCWSTFTADLQAGNVTTLFHLNGHTLGFHP